MEHDAAVDQIVNALLYEGYLLYPYRPSLKNAQLATFGGIYPREYCEHHGVAEPWRLQAQCIVEGVSPVEIEVDVRFLRYAGRRVGRLRALEPAGHPEIGAARKEPSGWPVHVEHIEWVPSLDVEGVEHRSWQECCEQRVSVGPFALDRLCREPRRKEWAFRSETSREWLEGSGGEVAGLVERRKVPIRFAVEVAARQVPDAIIVSFRDRESFAG